MFPFASPRLPLALGCTLGALLLPASGLAQPRVPPSAAAQRAPTAAVLSEDGTLVAAQTGRWVRVWQTRSGKLLARRAVVGFFRGAVAPGALVVVEGGKPAVYRGASWAQKVALPGAEALAMGRTSISADGRVAAAIFPADGGVGDPDTVAVWDARKGRALGRHTLKKGGRVLGAVLSRDGRTLVVFGDHPQKGALLRVFALGKGKLRPGLRWQDKALGTTYAAALSPDGKTLALGAGEQLLLWRLKGQKRLAQKPTAAIKALFPPPLRGPAVRMPGAHQLAFSPDGSKLASLHAFGVVGAAVWSVEARGLRPVRWIKRPTTGGTLRQIGWDKDGTPLLITATYSPKVWIHRPKNDRFQTVRVLEPKNEK